MDPHGKSPAFERSISQEPKWYQVRGSIKAMWPQLTEDDIQGAGGDLKEVITIITQKSGENRESVEQKLSDFLHAVPE